MTTRKTRLERKERARARRRDLSAKFPLMLGLSATLDALNAGATWGSSPFELILPAQLERRR